MNDILVHLPSQFLTRWHSQFTRYTYDDRTCRDVFPWVGQGTDPSGTEVLLPTPSPVGETSLLTGPGLEVRTRRVGLVLLRGRVELSRYLLQEVPIGCRRNNVTHLPVSLRYRNPIGTRLRLFLVFKVPVVEPGPSRLTCHRSFDRLREVGMRR